MNFRTENFEKTAKAVITLPRQADVRVDFEATAMLYRGRAATPAAKAILEEAYEIRGGRPIPRELAALAHILAGGSRTQCRLFSAGVRRSSLCPCGCGREEDQDYLWRERPRWHGCREPFHAGFDLQ